MIYGLSLFFIARHLLQYYATSPLPLYTTGAHIVTEDNATVQQLNENSVIV